MAKCNKGNTVIRKRHYIHCLLGSEVPIETIIKKEPHKSVCVCMFPQNIDWDIKDSSA